MELLRLCNWNILSSRKQWASCQGWRGLLYSSPALSCLYVHSALHLITAWHACFHARVYYSLKNTFTDRDTPGWYSLFSLCLQKLMWSSTYWSMCMIQFKKILKEIGESIAHPTQSCSEVLNVTWDWGTLGRLTRSCRPSG